MAIGKADDFKFQGLTSLVFPKEQGNYEMRERRENE